ncbi:hypothetical protein Bca4012_065154 [Brassica carinata]
MLQHVAKGSITDLATDKLICKQLKEVSERPSVYTVFDLFNIPWDLLAQTHAEFYMTCYRHANPDAIYIKGLSDQAFCVTVVRWVLTYLVKYFQRGGRLKPRLRGSLAQAVSLWRSVKIAAVEDRVPLVYRMVIYACVLDSYSS